MATVPAVAWLAPVSVLGGVGNGGVNVAAGVLLGRRVPAAMRGRAFAVFGAVANGAIVAGYVLGGALLGVLPVRAIIAAAGLGGLAATAACTLPVLRASARERDAGPGGAGPPANRTGRASGPAAPGTGPGHRAGQRPLADQAGGPRQASRARRAGVPGPGRPLR